MEGMMMRLEEKFPNMRDAVLLAEIERCAVVRHLLTGDIYLAQGEKIGMVPLVLSGMLKVILEDESDREIMLYEVNPGESCAVVWQGIFSDGMRMPATIVAEEPTSILAIPENAARDWIGRYPAWTQFAFKEINHRMDDVLDLVKQLSFCNNDDRILDHLKKKALVHGTADLALTHSELARELGTVREVVSRRLKVLEKRGLLQMGRGKIHIN